MEVRDIRVRPGTAGWRDAALAAAMAALNASVLAGVSERGAPLHAAAWALSFGHALPVAVRRRWPVEAFAVSTAAGAAYLLLGWPMVGLGVTVLVMLYALGAEAPRRASLTGLLAVQLLLVVIETTRSGGVQVDTLVGNVVTLAAAWAVGDSARRRRELARAEQERLARRAVADERLRIARELHDVVAHSMSVIAVQAGTGRLVLDDDPGAARRALTAIERTSREALDEMRRLLDVLRGEDAGEPSRSPMPGLGDLDRLVAEAATGGTTVDLHVDGTRRPLPPGVELTAFRIVQEALTNVRKHAPGAVARVRLRFEGDHVEVQIDNDVPAAGPVGDGHGLSGMKERVALYGGALEAHPVPGGFRVWASIPVGAER